MAEITHENFGKLIDLAGELAGRVSPGTAVADKSEQALELRLRAFDMALKALYKTVVEVAQD